MNNPVNLLCILLLAIALTPVVSRRLRLPPIVVLIVTGAVLGTHGLGLIERDSQLILLEKLGLLFIMFLAGLQMTLTNLRKLGLGTLVFGLLTFGLPLMLGSGTGMLLQFPVWGAVLLGLTYSPHTLVSYPLAVGLGIGATTAVNVAVGGTVITTVLTLSGYAIVQSASSGTLGLGLGVKLLVLLPLLTGLSFWMLPRWGRKLLRAEGLTPALQVTVCLAIVFTLAALTQVLGVDSIVGAFLAGLALNPVVPPQSPLLRQLEVVGHSLFIPAFMVSVGVLCNLRVLVTNPESLGLAGLIIVGAVGTKGLAAWAAGRLFQFNGAEVMTILGLTMSRAALILVLALFGQESGLLSAAAFNALILYIAVTCLVGPLVTNYFGRKVAAHHDQDSPAIAS